MPRRLFLATLLVSFMCALAFASSAAVDTPATDGRKRAGATVAPMPFEPAEQLVYSGEFSKYLLRGIDIAELKFTAGRATAAAAATSAGKTGEPLKTDVAPPLVFTGDVVSKGFFRKLFGIHFRYRVESVVEPETFSVLRTSKLDEQGKRVRTSEAVFDRAENKVSWTELDPNDPARQPRVVTTPLNGATHDIISAIYFLRTQTLAPGRTLELTVSDSGKIYRVPMKVFAEKKRMKTVIGRVPVVRVEVELFGKERLIQEDGQMQVWITDDARRIPVRTRISGDLGTLEIKLKSFSNAAVQNTRRG